MARSHPSEKAAPFPTDERRPAAAHAPQRARFARLRPEKCFRQRTHRGRKRIKFFRAVSQKSIFAIRRELYEAFSQTDREKMAALTHAGWPQYRRMTATTRPKTRHPSPSMGWYSGLEFSGYSQTWPFSRR